MTFQLQRNRPIIVREVNSINFKACSEHVKFKIFEVKSGYHALVSVKAVEVRKQKSVERETLQKIYAR